MTTANIEIAIAEAREFIVRAEAVLNRAKVQRYTYAGGDRESGSLRRQSMELTRALAEMRKP